MIHRRLTHRFQWPKARKVILGLVLFLFFSISYSVAETPRGAQGLLELPALRAHVTAGKPLDGFALQVFDAPTRAAKSRRVVAGDKAGQLVLKEHGYEEYSVVVLERRTGSGQRWARVSLAADSLQAGGSAWLPEPAGVAFRSYADLVKESLAFLTEAWDGRVWDSPGGAPPNLSKAVPFNQVKRPEHAADVFEYREVSGQLWLRVKVFSESPCETEQPVSLIEGWVPAYNTRGQWTADFYSRGC